MSLVGVMGDKPPSSAMENGVMLDLMVGHWLGSPVFSLLTSVEKFYWNLRKFSPTRFDFCAILLQNWCTYLALLISIFE